MGSLHYPGVLIPKANEIGAMGIQSRD